ncbi:MAG: RidA family protein [Pseudonocardiaceae bacterium]
MNPAIRLIRSAELSVAPYAYASVVDSAVRLVFLAGACPLEKDGTTAAMGDFAGQAAKCIETLSEALRAVGATLENVVNTRVLVASSQRSDLGVVWEIVRDAFGDHDVPSTLMGVTVLGYEDQLVEIEAIAAVSD